jgi:cytochrome c-type biogenesis protein CcmH
LVFVTIVGVPAIVYTQEPTNAANEHATTTAAIAGEGALLGRLVAPCCWLQTLDMHESPSATSLRAEIHTRLAQGEPSEAIEDDLAARYGERVRAVPKGFDRRGVVPALVALGLGLTAIALARALRRWRAASEASAPVRPSARLGTVEPGSDAYDEALDRALAELDD